MKKTNEKIKRQEKSELTLFEALILEELGRYQQAIDLILRKDRVNNNVSKNERLARLYHLIGDQSKAIESLE